MYVQVYMYILFLVITVISTLFLYTKDHLAKTKDKFFIKNWMFQCQPSWGHYQEDDEDYSIIEMRPNRFK